MSGKENQKSADDIVAIDEIVTPEYEHAIESFPDKEKYIFKQKFEQRYKLLLGEDGYKKFVDYSLSFKRRGIRVNTLKITVDEIKKRIGADWNLISVPWYDAAFWIEHKADKDSDEYRRDVGNLIEHSLGYIYIQDPASAIPPLVLDVKPTDHVLDMCAAPGSKTTQLAQLMNNKGIIVANELVGARIAALGVNVQRMGCTNVIITQCDATRMHRTVKYNKILVDAPCSGVGTIRKSPKTILMWNPSGVEKLVRIQQRLLSSAYELLEDGGTIVYSTCTTEPQENEGMMSWFVNQYQDMQIAPIKLNIKRSEPVMSFDDVVYNQQVKDCLRIWPFDNDTEGFFVCKLIKAKKSV